MKQATNCIPFDKLWINTIKTKFQDHSNSILPIFSKVKSFREVNNVRKASIFVPLCNRHNVASIIFTQRSTKVGTHKGQVSFPGGHIDLNETPIQAAIRETYEELGFDIGQLTVLGEAQRIPAVTGTLVTPVVGFIEKDVLDFQHFNPSQNEIEEVFTVPIHTLLDPSFRKTEMLHRRLSKESIVMNTSSSEQQQNSIDDDKPMEFPYFGEKNDPYRIW